MSSVSAIRVMLFAVLVPASYLMPTALAQEPQAQNAPAIVPRTGLTQDDVAKLQAQLQENPDDLNVRIQLLMYHQQQGHREEFVEQLLWIVRNRPESLITAVSPLAPDEYYQVKPAWEQALANHTDSPQVLFNAALFFGRTDPERALQILQRAREQDGSPHSGQYLEQIARIYSRAVITDLRSADDPARLDNLSPASAATLRSQLQQSTDPALLCRTGELLIENNRPRLAEQKEAGLQLIQRAIILDPSNAQWKAALESAKTEQIRSTASAGGALPIIGGKVSEANLLNRVEPVYPPLALQARVQGDVEFTAAIGPNGHVENLTLVRGHPLLVNAAKDAVLQWTYRPTLLNGQPIGIVTDVIVPFRLPQ